MGNVRARGDVGVIIFGFGIKGIGRSPVVQFGIDFAEIPRIRQLHVDEINLRVGAQRVNIIAYALGKRAIFFAVKQLHAVEADVGALVQGDVGPPFLPTGLPEAVV